MRHRLLSVVLVSVASSATIVACSDRSEVAVSESAPVPIPASESSAQEALERARALAKKVGGGLKLRLVEAMAEGGPSAAITVCADEAQAITRAAVAEGQSAGRASTKLRNPDNAGPPWVDRWLRDQGDAAADATPLARVEDGHARVIVPIGVDGVCLNCHGDVESLAPEVRAVLAQRYPNDRATGYGEGDLRGALWAEVPVR